MTGDIDVSALLGTWQLTSWVQKNLDTNESEEPLGSTPFGFISFGQDGRVHVIAVTAPRQAPASLADVSTEEAAALYTSLMAYSGRYVPVSENEMHFEIDIAWNQVWVGETQDRHFTIDGDKLSITVGPQKGINGEEVLATLNWVRWTGQDSGTNDS